MSAFVKRVLAAILCLGFLIRILYLGRRQLWTDELLQALVVRSSPLAVMMDRLRGGVPLPAPLDLLIQKFFVFFLGESSWSLRFHSVVLATCSLWFFFRIARRLFGDLVALYSTALLAIYPLHYHYSQEGRPTALLLLLTLISFDLLMRVIGRDRTAGGWMLLALLLTLLLYSSPLGFLVLFAQLSFLIASAVLQPRLGQSPAAGEEGESTSGLPASSWRDAAAYAVAATGACVAFIPWMRFLRGSPTLPHAHFSFDIRALLTTIRWLGDNSPFVLALLAAGTLCGIRALLRHHRHRSLVLLTSWGILPLMGALALDLCSSGWDMDRTVSVAALPLLLVAGYGLTHIGERMTILDSLPYRISSPAIAYLVILGLSSAWIAQSRWKNEPVDWRGAAHFLQQQVKPGDALSMPKCDSLLEYYAPRLAQFRIGGSKPDLNAGGRLIAVCLDSLHPDPCQAIRAGVAKDRYWAGIDSFKGFRIYIRESPAAASTK